MEKIEKIQLDQILESPWQGRLLDFGTRKTEDKTKDNIKQLAENIKINGLITPISVRVKGDQYELIDGHRRVEASRFLGKKNILAVIKNIEDKEAQTQSIVANLQREELSNIEKAIAFEKILAAGIFSSKRELSKAIGKDETFIGDLLNTLKMDKRILKDLLENHTTDDVRALRAIRRVEEADENKTSYKQWALYQKFIENNLSRKQLLEEVSKKKLQETEAFSISFNPRRIEVSFNEKIPKDKREEFSVFLSKQINDFLGLKEQTMTEE